MIEAILSQKYVLIDRNFLASAFLFSSEEIDMVTVVITTCRREPHIVNRAIQSVIKQTYTKWQLIIVDDSPSSYEYRSKVKDIVQAIPRNYDILFIQNKNNYGACYSRNLALEKAKGKYVAFLDDDDEWLENKLEVQVNVLENSDSSVALVYGPYYKYDDDTQKSFVVEAHISSGSLYDNLMKKGNFIGGMSMPLIKTSCIKSVGGFDNKMQSAQDMDLWLRISQKYNIICIENPLVIYHIHANEQISKNPLKKIMGLEKLNEKNITYLRSNRKTWWEREISLVQYYLMANRKKDAIKKWIKVITINPLEIRSNTKELIRILVYRCGK